MLRVAALLPEATRLFDYGVIYEVFGVDRAVEGVPRFTLWTCAPGRRVVTAENGLAIRPDRGLAALAEADLVLVSSTQEPGRPVPPGVRRALRDVHDAGVPIAALCAGAFVLAGSGLLDGRSATTHWMLAESLARCFPAVRVVRGPLWVSDGALHTSAGTAAGIDLLLHLVREAHGAAVAAAIARRMVTPPHRDGGQAQYVERAVPGDDELAGLLAWARAHLDAPLTVGALARRARQAPRTFARRFFAGTGTTPLRWLHHERVQLAQELLERTDAPVEEVARRSGFGSVAVLRRHFGRDLGTTPTAYRAAHRHR